MKSMIIFAAGALVLSGCTAVRSAKSKTPDEIANVDVCLKKPALAKKVGGADEKISIPGGGHIEIHDVMVRNPNANPNPATSAALSVMSLGIIDLTAGLGDAVYDCKNATNVSGFNSKCDFKRLKFFVHYTDENAKQASCIEKKEVWVGASFYSGGDNSRCPIEYKNALSELIDTSDFPTATLSWKTGAPTDEQRAFLTRLDDLSAYEQLQLMKADHQANCPK